MGRLIPQNPHTAILTPQNTGSLYRKIYEVVEELPTENIKTTVIYCVPADNPSEGNDYDKWLYVNGEWENLGGGGSDFKIFVINEETVPESVNWNDEIPDTFAGSLADVALWEGQLWYLSNVVDSPQSRTFYYWTPIATVEDIATKMDLAPVNPSAEDISDMEIGQVYSDTKNHKGVIKTGANTKQEFYDTNYIDSLIQNKQSSIIFEWALKQGGDYTVGDIFCFYNALFQYTGNEWDSVRGYYNVFNRISGGVFHGRRNPYSEFGNEECPFRLGDIFAKVTGGANAPEASNLYRCTKIYETIVNGEYSTKVTWTEIPIESYSKAEINSMIGNVGTALDTLNENLSEV